MAIAERELAASAHTQFYTEEEYLVREETAEERSEYVHGELQPMSGGTDDHAFISGNVSSALRAVLRGHGCRVYGSDMKIYADGAMRYPDVSVVQGPRIYHGGNRTVISNPVLIAEVLSPSTKKLDRGEKLREYLAIPTLQVYLLVSQSEPRVEMYLRGENEEWNFQEVFGLDSVLEVSSLSVSLALSSIYEDIEFD